MNEPGSTVPTSMSARSANLLTRLHRYRQLLRRRWWIIVIAALTGLAYQGFHVLGEPPSYVSVGRMMVKMRINLPEGGVAVQEDLINFFGTQIELMKSVEVQHRAQARLRNLRGDLKSAPVSLSVTRAKDTSVFVSTATGGEPEYTQAFLDACMTEYISLKKEMRFQTSNSTLAAVTEQIERLEKEIRQREDDLFEFKKQNNIVSLENRQNAIDGRLKQLNDQLTAVKTEYDLLQPEGVTPPVSVETTPAGSDLAKTRQQLQLIMVKREDLLKTYKPDHPRIMGLDGEITQLEQMIRVIEHEREEMIRVIEQERAGQRRSHRELLKARTQNLEKTIREEEANALEVSRPMAEYQKIKSELGRVQGLHDQLLSSMKSIDLSKNIDQEIINIMEHATAAASTRGSPIRQLGWGLLIGIAAGAGILLLLDRVDDRMVSLTEVAAQFSERVVGQIPEESTLRNAPSIGTISSDSPTRHHFTEAFRHIRSSLFYIEPDGQKVKTLLLTSASPGEGKSTVAANLAMTLASAGSRVLLIDADLRRGTIHKLFGISSAIGFSDILSQRARWVETLVAWKPCPGLSIIPCGEIIPNPGEIFLNPYTEIVLKELRDSFDCVIMDSAPILAVDDTSSLAPKLDGVLFVIRASSTSARLAQRSLEILYNRHVHVLGLVVNGVNTALPDYYYYQYSSYHSLTSKSKADAPSA